MEHTYTKKVSIHLKCTIYWTSCILSGNSIWEPGNHGNNHIGKRLIALSLQSLIWSL